MKRTKKQKIKASLARVNSQMTYKFEGTYNLSTKKVEPMDMGKSTDLGSIKKELYKSLFVALLILTTLTVIYWFS